MIEKHIQSINRLKLLGIIVSMGYLQYGIRYCMIELMVGLILESLYCIYLNRGYNLF